MRVDGHAPGALDESTVHVTLSRRNLLSLLAKLDGHPAGSSCTLIRYSTPDKWSALIVQAEEDAVHYADRTPGPMHPDTEAQL
jgi:hypothetical protein